MMNPFKDLYFSPLIYYVYSHVDPMTKEVFYIGFGSGARAYQVDLSLEGRKAKQRDIEHNKYMWKLINEGYVPHEWVRIEYRELTREQACKLERYLIEKYNPQFNKKVGRPNKLKPEQILEAKRLRDLNYTYAQLENIMECPRSVIHRAIKGHSNEQSVSI